MPLFQGSVSPVKSNCRTKSGLFAGKAATIAAGLLDSDVNPKKDIDAGCVQ
jgi:hypothetical protein